MTPWIKKIEIKNVMPELLRPINLCYEIRTGSEYASCGRNRRAEQHCIFHYCLQGHGRVRYQNREYDIFPEHGFLCVINDPDMDYFYPASETLPWHFYWISYVGGMARELTHAMIEEHGPVFPLPRYSAPLQIFAELEQMPVPYLEMDAYEAAMIVTNLLLTLGRNYSRINRLEYSPLISEAEKLLKNIPSVFSVGMLAQRLGVSREYLSRLYRQEKGINLKEAIDEFKCAYACSLLFDPQMQIKTIAAQTGFSNTSNFARMFKTRMKMSPEEYRIYQRKKLL